MGRGQRGRFPAAKPARYGRDHQRLRANRNQAVGSACSRCGQLILAGQEVSPDHVDGGGPTEYRGWSHVRCNLSAGATYGNRLRAAAYRRARGLPEPLAAKTASNGAAAAVVAASHDCVATGCHVDRGRCGCGRHSRGW
jgi:hypothetical protein